MSAFTPVIQAYRDAWHRRTAFVGVYLALRLVAFAILTPAVGVLINLAVSVSSQSALTDQDIARFLLTPSGFIVAIAVASVFLVVEVFGFAIMAAYLRAGVPNRLHAARMAMFAIVGHARNLFVFALLLVLRVLVIAVPFVLASLLIFKFLMSEFDINYYLTFHPPEFFIAVGLIGVLVAIMALILLARLTSWAVALHMVLFDDVAPNAAFGKSAAKMLGHRWRFLKAVLFWLAIRVGVVLAIGLLVGGVLHVVPMLAEIGLRLVLTLTLAVVALWWLAGEVVNALALGAMAKIVNGFYTGSQPMQAVPQSAGVSMRRRLIIAGLALVALGIGGFWSGARLLDVVQAEDHVVIIAHRGAAGSRPENTLASVQKAIEDGTDWVEIDVQETVDGDIVVVHDSDFMKLAEVDLKVWNATLDDLADIDIGSWFDAQYADQRTPLLRDVLEMAKGKAKVLIELKYYGHDVDLENRVIAIVEDLDMADQIATMSLKYPAVQKMKTLRPDWRTGVLAATGIGKMAGLEGEFVAVNTAMVNSSMVRSMQAANKDLYVWTVNDPLEMSKMISMGVSGLITDEPALVHRVLEVRAGLSTPERLILWFSEALGVRLTTKEYRDDAP